jgi:hypothetical protein
MSHYGISFPRVEVKAYNIWYLRNMQDQKEEVISRPRLLKRDIDGNDREEYHGFSPNDQASPWFQHLMDIYISAVTR